MRPFTVEVSFKDGVVHGKIDFCQAADSATLSGVHTVTPGVVFLEDGVKALTAITAAAQGNNDSEPTTFGALVMETIDVAIARYNDRGPKATEEDKPGTATQIGFLAGDEALNPLPMLTEAGFNVATIKLSRH